MEVDFNELVIQPLRKPFNSIVSCGINRVVLKGGRASTKSQVAAYGIIAGCMSYKQSAVCVLNTDKKIGEVFVPTLTDAMERMGVTKYWKLRRCPFEYVLLDGNGKETNVSIKMASGRDPKSLKSMKPRLGSFRYVWFEEAANFDSVDQITSIINSLARGEGQSTIIFTYNPPKSNTSWVNEEWEYLHGDLISANQDLHLDVIKKTKTSETGEEYTYSEMISHTTYLDVCRAGHSSWIGPTLMAQILDIKDTKPDLYKLEYLGIPGGGETSVFPNLVQWDGIFDSSNNAFNSDIRRGLDFSNSGSNYKNTADPHSYVEWAYDKSSKSIYLINGFSKNCGIAELARDVEKYNKHCFKVSTDGAVGITTETLNAQLKSPCCAPAIKGPDSIRAGIMWLQDLNAIYICKYKTKEAFEEFSKYEYLLDKDDKVTTKLPDKNNHSIDATRYAFVDDIRAR